MAAQRPIQSLYHRNLQKLCRLIFERLGSQVGFHHGGVHLRQRPGRRAQRHSLDDAERLAEVVWRSGDARFSHTL